ncbi:MAG: calcium-binding protein [Paracoccus sp. (in: a-proteobacteria)]
MREKDGLGYIGGVDALDSIDTIPNAYDPDFDYFGTGLNNAPVEYAERIHQDWGAILNWFNNYADPKIAEAVYGWELLNEPIAYPISKYDASRYAQHMSAIIEDYSDMFGDKRILVGGMNASAQFGKFNDLDLDMIRDAAMKDGVQRLIWSMHAYKTEAVPGDAIDPNTVKDHFDNFILDRGLKEVDGRIRAILQDDIIVTEAQLQTGADRLNMGSLNYNPDFRKGNGDPEVNTNIDAIKSFNMQQVWQWYAENGIGMTWFAPVDLNSSLLAWYKNTNYTVYAESAALAHEMWGYKESANSLDAADSLDTAEHYGTSGADYLAVGGGGVDPDRITEGLIGDTLDGTSSSNSDGDKRIGNYGLVFGFDGNDTITGSNIGQGAYNGVDMLYGGTGNDSILGMGGNDYLFGGEGTDTIWGGEGNDTIIDRSGSGEARGGAGDDYIQIAGGKSYGDDGNDTLLFSGNGNQTAYGGNGADTFVAMGDGQIGVKDFSAADADKLSLAFWADNPDVDRLVVKMHLNGQGEATGSLIVSNEVGGSYRVFGGYSSSSPLDFSVTNFVDAEGVWIAYQYFDGVGNKIAYRIADGGNVKAFDPTTSDYSNGKFFGNATSEVIVLDENAQFWGGAGRDIFVATDLNVRIRDFNVSADSDYIDLSAWNLGGSDEIQISNRLTGGGDRTNEVYIHDGAGHNIRVALYDENATDTLLDAGDMNADMFIL